MIYNFKIEYLFIFHLISREIPGDEISVSIIKSIAPMWRE